MMNFKQWQVINETYGHYNLGVKNPRSVGAVGSKLAEMGLGADDMADDLSGVPGDDGGLGGLDDMGGGDLGGLGGGLDDGGMGGLGGGDPDSGKIKLDDLHPSLIHLLGLSMHKGNGANGQGGSPFGGDDLGGDMGDDLGDDDDDMSAGLGGGEGLSGSPFGNSGDDDGDDSDSPFGDDDDSDADSDDDDSDDDSGSSPFGGGSSKSSPFGGSSKSSSPFGGDDSDSDSDSDTDGDGETDDTDSDDDDDGADDDSDSDPKDSAKKSKKFCGTGCDDKAMYSKKFMGKGGMKPALSNEDNSFLNSLVGMGRGEVRQKFESGVPAQKKRLEPKPGDVGYAPQGRVNTWPSVTEWANKKGKGKSRKSR